MFRAAFILVFFACLFSCREDENPLANEEVLGESPEKRRHFCDFDLSDKPGVFELNLTWEFVGFQDILTGEIEQNITCNARAAHFALNGEDFDKLLKITVIFEKEISESGSCVDLPAFEARTITRHINGCYQDGAEGLVLAISESDISDIPSNVANTLPVQYFERVFLEYLLGVRVYHIEANKLYLYGKEGPHRMIFLALD